MGACELVFFNSWRLMWALASFFCLVYEEEIRALGFLRLTTIDTSRVVCLQAARYGDVEDVQEHLRQGISADSQDAEGRSALFFACANGHLEVGFDFCLVELFASASLPPVGSVLWFCGTQVREPESLWQRGHALVLLFYKVFR